MKIHYIFLIKQQKKSIKKFFIDLNNNYNNFFI